MNAIETYSSVWDAIADTHEEAEIMKLRSALMMKLERHIDRTGLSPDRAASLLGITEPQVSDLLCGRLSQFNLEELIKIAAAAGWQVEIRVRGSLE